VRLQRDDWDDEERQALKGLEPELEQLRSRHANDVPFELLRAAHADALPESLQASLTEHLKGSAWSRALVEGDAEAEPSLDEVAEARLLDRIGRASRSKPSAGWPMRSWAPALAAAAVLVIMVGVLRSGAPARWFDRTPPTPTPETTVASAPRAPVFVLAFDKPEVKLTQQALVLRSDARGARFVDDIAPALKAYNAGDYAEADRQFASLLARYPQSVEVPFYRAMTQLFLNDPSSAIQSLQAARRLDDGAFAPEIAWYLAVAYERAGDPPRARAELDGLCRRTTAFTSRACEGAPKLDSK
jgi:tetratricopeptide (TPR) repeat protein